MPPNGQAFIEATAVLLFPRHCKIITCFSLPITHELVDTTTHRYKNNTLVHGDDDEFHTYFNDMAGTDYRLYEFVRVSDAEKKAAQEKKKSANKKKRRGKKKSKQAAEQEEELPF